MALRMHDRERLWNPQGATFTSTLNSLVSTRCGCSRKPGNPLHRMCCWTFIRTWWEKLVMGKLGACWQLGKTKNGDDPFKSICSDGQSSSQRKDDPRARQDPLPHALISGPLALHAG